MQLPELEMSEALLRMLCIRAVLQRVQLRELHEQHYARSSAKQGH